MASFTVHGPFELQYEDRKGGRVLSFNDFWDEDADVGYLADKKGCYVFAIRNKAMTPLYVGKATKTFRQETFNASNKHKYNNGFSNYAIGTPVMFFVLHPEQKGKTNTKHISEIEDFLIQAGFAKNPNIQNKKGTQQPQWSIKGVVRSTGKRKKCETQFAGLFDIRR